MLATSSAAARDSRIRVAGSIWASTSTRTTSCTTIRPSPTPSASWRAISPVSAASMSTPGASAEIPAGATGARRIASASSAPRAAASRLDSSHASAPNRARASSRRSASGTPRVRANAASKPGTSPQVSSRLGPQGTARLEVEPGELDLRDRGADRGRERITAHDDHASERGRPEQQRPEQARRLVGPQVLDVIDHEHARLIHEGLRQRAGRAAQRSLGARPQRHGTITREALDHRARDAEPGGELADQPALAGAERAMDRDQRHHRQVLLELRQLVFPAYERHRTDGGHGVGDLGLAAAEHASAENSKA